MTSSAMPRKSSATSAAAPLRGAAYARAALLPEGFHDALAPVAEQQANVAQDLMQVFQQFGYDRVRPPLIEFEDSLFAGPGEAKAGQCFRLMDPESQKGMALRADITPQISRLAATRLEDTERPLRLTYAGSVLRVLGSQIRPTREFTQAGIEIIGTDTIEADAEVINVVLSAVRSVGISDLTLDLTLAPLSACLIEEADLEADQKDPVIAALAARDVGALSAAGFGPETPIGSLVRASGPVAEALQILKASALSEPALAMVLTVETLADHLQTLCRDVMITFDPCETHGFEYKAGVGFALFTGSSRSELGRGGRYLVAHPGGQMEPATGFSAYLDSLLSAVPAFEAPQKIYVPFGTDPEQINQLQSEDWRTVQGFDPPQNNESEAKRLGCAAFWDGRQIQYLAR